MKTKIPLAKWLILEVIVIEILQQLTSSSHFKVKDIGNRAAKEFDIKEVLDREWKKKECILEKFNSRKLLSPNAKCKIQI